MNLCQLVRTVVVLLVAAGSVIFSARASAEERQHFLRGTAVLDLRTGIVEGAGLATHLGNYTEAGLASVSGDNPFALQVEGDVILTAANGVDKLYEHVSGQLNFITGDISATVTFMGGEGRFEDATGTASLVAHLELDGPIATIAVVVAGKINY